MNTRSLFFINILCLIVSLCVSCNSDVTTTSDYSSNSVNPTSQNNSTNQPSSVEEITYVINFDLNGGSSESYSGSKTINHFSKDIFFFDCIKSGWNFRGWFYNDVKIFDEKGNQLATPTMASSMTFVAHYSQTAKMNIATNLPEAGTVVGEGEYPYNTYVDVGAHPNQGYAFVGWYYNETLLSNTEDYKYMMWSEDVTLEARFKLASFAMNVHSNNSTYGLVILQSPTNYDYLNQYEEYREYTSSITIAAYSKTDVRFLGWYDVNNRLVETNAVYTFVMPDHDYTLEAKWNYFTISYELNDGVNNVNNPTYFTIDSGSVPLFNPTKTGYDFLGWKYKNSFVESINSSWIDNIVLVAIWSAHEYEITYVLDDGINSPNNPNRYTINSETIILSDPSKQTCTFGGWFKQPDFSDEITEIPSGSYGELTIYAKWYTWAETHGGIPIISQDGKTVSYGLYPQRNINDSELIHSLNSLETTAANGWYLFEDDYYAKLVANPYEDNYYFDNGTKIVDGYTYWFKCEPIIWDVVSISNGKYLLLSDVLLDCHRFNDASEISAGYYANNYERSEIRQWLNADFSNSAFAFANKSTYLKTTEIDNSASTTKIDPNPYACNNTVDEVFLLSYQDYQNDSYGFSTSSSRCCKTSDWTRAHMIYCSNTANLHYTGTYWTRSPSSNKSDASFYMLYDGYFSDYEAVDFDDKCVRPAISITF